jgi:hypothetical protein
VVGERGCIARLRLRTLAGFALDEVIPISIDVPRWWARWPHRCLTVVDDGLQSTVMAAMGVEPKPEWAPASSERPPVRVVSVGSAHLVFEPGGVEGSRREVLRRLSGSGRRALCYAVTGTGMSMLGYAEDGVVVTWFELQELSDPARSALAELTAVAGCWGLDAAEVVSASMSGWELATRLFAAGFGVQLTRDLSDGPAVDAHILPVLPDLPSCARVHVNSRATAELAALLSAASPQRITEVVRIVAARVTAAAGLAGDPQVASALGTGTAVTNDSNLGRLLRAVIADGQLSTDPPLSEQDRAARRRAGRALYAALSAPADTAIVLLLRARTSVPVYRIVLDALADVEVPREALRAELAKLPADSQPPMLLNTSMLPTTSGIPSSVRSRHGSRAVAQGKLPPLTGEFRTEGQ